MTLHMWVLCCWTLYSTNALFNYFFYFLVIIYRIGNCHFSAFFTNSFFQVEIYAQNLKIHTLSSTLTFLKKYWINNDENSIVKRCSILSSFITIHLSNKNSNNSPSLILMCFTNWLPLPKQFQNIIEAHRLTLLGSSRFSIIFTGYNA